MNIRVLATRTLSRVEIQRRYRARKQERLRLSRQAAMPQPLNAHTKARTFRSHEVTTAERLEWARNRVYEAADRAIAHPDDSAYEVAYQSRLSELEALERVPA